MLKIRLQRIGKKNDPSFKVVLTDSKNGPKSGKFQEILGNYNAQKGEPKMDGERIKHWMSVGAQVSDTVHNLLIKLGILEGKKRDVLHHTKIKAKLDAKKPKEEVKPASAPAEIKEEKKEETKPAEDVSGEKTEKTGSVVEEKVEAKEVKTE